MLITERQKRYFIAVAEHCNVTKAAQALHVAQPAVSRQLKFLEDAVGTALFCRHTNGMSLTAAGEFYLRSIKRLVEQEEHAIARTRSIAHGFAARLRVGASDAVSWHPCVTSTICKFRTLYPDVELTYETGRSGVVTGKVINNRADVAIAYVGPLLPRAEISTIACVETEYCLAVRASSKYSACRDVFLYELRPDVFVCFSPKSNPSLYEGMRHHISTRGLMPSRVMHGSCLMAVLDMVAGNVGYALVPRIPDRLIPGGVILVPVPDLELRVEIGAIWAKGAASDLAKRFALLLNEEFLRASTTLAKHVNAR